MAEWLARVGPSVLFFAQIFGLFGPPLPDELLLILAGLLVRQGAFNATFTIAAAVGGCAGGITLSFALGKTLGAAALAHPRLSAHRAALARAQQWFARFGVWLLAFGYFVPGARHVSAITAGIASLTYRRFAGAAYPGALLWCAVYLGLGYFAGDRWPAIAAVLPGRRLSIAAIAAAALVICLVLIRASSGGRRSRRDGP